MPSQATARKGRFVLFPTEEKKWSWSYFSRANDEICRSCPYQSKAMAYRGLMRFLRRMKLDVPEVRYKGLLGDDNYSGYFAVKPLADKPTIEGPYV